MAFVILVSENQSRKAPQTTSFRLFVSQKRKPLRGWDLPLGTVTKPEGEPGPLTHQAVSSVYTTHTPPALLFSPSCHLSLGGMEQRKGQRPHSPQELCLTGILALFLHFLLPHSTLPEPTTQTSRRVESLYGIFTFTDKITKPRGLCVTV